MYSKKRLILGFVFVISLAILVQHLSLIPSIIRGTREILSGSPVSPGGPPRGWASIWIPTTLISGIVAFWTGRSLVRMGPRDDQSSPIEDASADSFCAKCRTVLEPEDSYCSECGMVRVTYLRESGIEFESAATFCNNCGTDFQRGSAFCSECGQKRTTYKRVSGTAQAMPPWSTREGKKKIAARVAGSILAGFLVLFVLKSTGPHISNWADAIQLIVAGGLTYRFLCRALDPPSGMLFIWSWGIAVLCSSLVSAAISVIILIDLGMLSMVGALNGFFLLGTVGVGLVIGSIIATTVYLLWYGFKYESNAEVLARVLEEGRHVTDQKANTAPAY